MGGTIPQGILDTKVPINDIGLYLKAFDILHGFGENVKKNDMQIYVGLKRSEAQLPKVGSTSGWRMREIVDSLDDVWLKKDERLGKYSGQVAKPFEGIYQNSSGNVWRNPIGTQKGISCFAPDDIISNTSFLEEDRTICEYRIGYNRCRFAPDTTCNPYHFPKLLQIARNRRRYEYRKTEWTVKSVLFLLGRDEQAPKLPLIPTIVAVYFGAHHSLTKNRDEIAVSDFKSEFSFTDEEFDAVFDMSPTSGFEILPQEEVQEIPVEDERDVEREITDQEVAGLPAVEGRIPNTRIKEKMYYVDEVKLEQANTQHRRITVKLSQFLKSRGLTCLRLARTDLVSVSGNEAWLFEVKSLTEDNERKQARNGVGQLFDYEFVECARYRNTHSIIKALVFEKKPTDEIVKWLRYVGILSFWLNSEGEIAGEEESVRRLNQLAGEDRGDSSLDSFR